MRVPNLLLSGFRDFEDIEVKCKAKIVQSHFPCYLLLSVATYCELGDISQTLGSRRPCDLTRASIGSLRIPTRNFPTRAFRLRLAGAQT